MKLLNTQFGGALSARDLDNGFKAVMRNSLAPGKGVLTGMEVTPGTGLALNVAPGEFQAQVHDDLGISASVPVPAHYSGWLWVEANSDPGDVPAFDYQGTDADYGSNWVCLGHFASTADSVAYDEAGRKMYGWRSQAAVMADLESRIQSAVPKFRTETPIGLIDGQNATFTLSFAPIHGGLTLNVTGFDPGDYTLDGASIAFDVAPPVGATLKAQYPYL